MTIWGNHSATQYPDLQHALISNAPATDDLDMDWYASDFIPTVQQRGAAIIEAELVSSVCVHAAIVICAAGRWSSPDNDWVSMGVISDGAYGIEPGLIYSFPCRCSGGEWEIVEGLDISTFSREKMDATAQELIEERDAVAHLLG